MDSVEFEVQFVILPVADGVILRRPNCYNDVFFVKNVLSLWCDFVAVEPFDRQRPLGMNSQTLGVTKKRLAIV